MNNYTFATLLSTASYIPGVLTLYRSLQRYGKTKYPFICVCSLNIRNEDIDLLQKEGVDCIKLNKSMIDGIQMPNRNGNYMHWNYTFDKLLLWGMIEYEKIVFLDSDMFVMDNVDDLFDYPDFSAVQAGFLQNNMWNRLNSGMIVVVPDMDTYKKLAMQLQVTVTAFVKSDKSVGDQDVLNDFYPQWISRKELHLPEGYNLFFKYLSLYHNLYGFCYGRDIKIVHFVGSHKPWHDGKAKQLLMSMKYLLQNRYGLMAYLKYIYQLSKK